MTEPDGASTGPVLPVPWRVRGDTVYGARSSFLEAAPLDSFVHPGSATPSHAGPVSSRTSHGKPPLGAYFARAEAIAAACEATARAARLVAWARAACDASTAWKRDSMRHLARSDDLVRQFAAARSEVRRAVTDLAHLERAAGSPPRYVVKLLTSIVDSARTSDSDCDAVHALQLNVILWGVEAYLAA